MNRTCKPLIQALLAGTALTQPAALVAGELPHGASAVHGSVGIATPSATQMTIQQTTPTAIVNWQGFSVGAGSRVDISQPSASSALLNRVTGATTSTIAGRINANGQVYLVNPNGIAITPTGAVKAGAFVASTLDVADQDFVAGRRVFRGTGQSAAVTNQGTIEIARGGYAALLGGRVDNAGVISVPMGRVGLGAGEQATLDLTGDGFLQVALPSKPDGSDAALIRHGGRIGAAGGRVEIQAATARDAARNAINLSGIVEARSVSGRNGAIVLGGGEGGAVTVSGRLDTSARASRQAQPRPARGGDITVTGSDIRLNGAALLADGRSGGGTIRVGGGYQGQGPLQRAGTTAVDAGTTLSADAGRTGNGGQVVVWSDRRTDFAGRISATGGAQGGDGGQAEVSGKSVLAYSGTTILTAEKGAFGTLLLDPYNVVISNGTDTTSGGFAASGNDSVINAGTLQNALRTASVTVTTGGAGSPGTQAGDITVAAPVTWGSAAGGPQGGTTLTLNAYRSINVNANLTVVGGGGLVLNTNQNQSGGTLTFGPNSSATFSGGSSGNQSLYINNQLYTLIRSTDLPTLLQSRERAGGFYALASDFDAAPLLGSTPLPAPINTQPATSSSPPVDIPFTGAFNGLGHTISNLKISSGLQYVGLFGTTSGANISNVNLVDLNVGSTYSGSGESYVGGLIGQANSNASGINTTVFGINIVRGSVANSSSSAPSSMYTGGLIGSGSATVTQAYSNATVTGGGSRNSSFTGGLIGRNFGTVAQSYTTGSVAANGVTLAVNDVGGLIGLNTGLVNQSYSTSNVRGGDSSAVGPAGDENRGSYTGGLVGFSRGQVSESYAAGEVRGGNAAVSNSYTGGLVGYSVGPVRQAYSTGSVSGGVSGNAYTGGLVGYHTAPIDQSYAAGVVVGGSSNGGIPSAFTGGLLGFAGGVTVTGSFWDATKTGQSAAAGNAASLIGATGLTTSQFQNPTAFVPLATNQGWNFQTTWAPPSAGFYPELYSVSRVIAVTANAATRTYGQINAALTGTVSGGPGVNAFDTSATRPDAATLLTTQAAQASGVGDYAISPTAAPFVSLGGVTYRVTGIGSTLSVTPAALTITANNLTKPFGQTLTFAGTEFTATGLVSGDQVTRVALASQGEPASAAASTYPIEVSNAQGTGLVNLANSRPNYTIAYVQGQLTVTPAPQPTQNNAERASGIANASVTPNVTTILPNFSTSALSLGDSVDVSGGGGPTIAVASDGQGGGGQTRAGAQNTLASIQRASNSLEAKVAACDRGSNAGPRGTTTCYSNALDSFADTLDIQVQQLPPAFRSLPAVIRQAASQVRAARTVAEARAAVRVAVVAVRKAISLLRADEPVVARLQVRQGNAIASALRTVETRLSRAVGL